MTETKKIVAPETGKWRVTLLGVLIIASSLLSACAPAVLAQSDAPRPADKPSTPPPIQPCPKDVIEAYNAHFASLDIDPESVELECVVATPTPAPTRTSTRTPSPEPPPPLPTTKAEPKVEPTKRPTVKPTVTGAEKKAVVAPTPTPKQEPKKDSTTPPSCSLVLKDRVVLDRSRVDYVACTLAAGTTVWQSGVSTANEEQRLKIEAENLSGNVEVKQLLRGYPPNEQRCQPKDFGTRDCPPPINQDLRFRDGKSTSKMTTQTGDVNTKSRPEMPWTFIWRNTSPTDLLLEISIWTSGAGCDKPNEHFDLLGNGKYFHHITCIW